MTERPEGWYPDPHTAGTQRFWDGSEWTDDVAPAAQSHVGLLVAGIVAAILAPIAGFIVGIILAGKNQILAGLFCMGLSVASVAFWATLLW